MGNNEMTRRRLLAASAGWLAASSAHAQPASQAVRFGVLADVHHSRMPDAQSRLEAFLAASGSRKLDFLIQVGDFCDGYAAQLKPEQKQFVETWHSARLPHYSVLGNHELDRGDKQHILDLLRMPRNFYSFDAGGFHFIVLDCMHLRENGKVIDYVEGNYFRHSQDDINLVDPEQMEWLAGNLKAATQPAIVFTHPCIDSFWYAGAEKTRADVRALFERINRDAGWSKVLACFSGHHHVDAHSQFGGTNYFLVNSASYFWVGEQYGSLAKYRDPLFMFVTIEPSGKLVIEGRNSVFLPPTPTEMKFPSANQLTASIENRTVSFRQRA